MNDDRNNCYSAYYNDIVPIYHLHQLMKTFTTSICTHSPPQTQADFTDPARQKSQQLLPHLHHGQPSRFTRPVANKRAARVCMIVSEAANENSQESPSHPSTQLSESPYSDIDSFAAEVSTLPPGGSHKAVSVDSHKFQRSDSLYSSRRSASRDSDVWHSESEANWTMVEANSTAITQSQVLTSSDDEREQQKGQTEASCSRQHSVTFDEPPSKIHQYELPPSIAEVPSKSELIAKKQYPTSTEEAHLPRDIATPDASVYGFETPRPLELYGPCSWNSLTLAVNSNLVKPSRHSFFCCDSCKAGNRIGMSVNGASHYIGSGISEDRF